uniref:Ig-like domain-containing protein n=1 Tax=Gopherus evgoodei TaxID=1825980 RepID=A0A8C4W134_9SAUR
DGRGLCHPHLLPVCFGRAVVCLTRCIPPTAELSSPKPSIFLNPSGGHPGGATTVQCQGQRRGLEFALYKAGARNAAAWGRDSAGVKFPIPKVSRAEEGSYTCYYPPDTWSEPSDPMELVVGSEGPGSATSLPVWHLTGCSEPGSAQSPRTHLDREGGQCHWGVPQLGGAGAPGVSGLREERSLTPGGAAERTRFVSFPLTACLFVTPEGSYPKPSISVSPSGVIPVGGTVTIRCWHQLLDMRILLYKDEDENYLNYTDPVGSEAEFPITSARWEHGGSYTCRYSNRTGEVAYSEPSDPVQIIVAGREYPKPTIWVSPSTVVALGGNVTIPVSIRCRGQHPGVRFVLNKEGRHFPPVDSDGLEAEFSTSNVHRDLGGSYTCSYHSRSEPFAVSYPSDPMELVVRGEGPGSASPFPAPRPPRSSWGFGANGTLRRGRPAGKQGQSLGGSPARGEQQPLETRGREATLTLPFVHRNRESLFNPLIPSPLFSRPCPRLNEAGAEGEVVAWWTWCWAGTQEIWPSSWRSHRLCVMGAHRGFQKCPCGGRGREASTLGDLWPRDHKPRCPRIVETSANAPSIALHKHRVKRQSLTLGAH